MRPSEIPATLSTEPSTPETRSEERDESAGRRNRDRDAVAPGAGNGVGSRDTSLDRTSRPRMRFAYIDSQGNEVDIPSVDALRLRIELGAIVDSTMFLDAHTGKWAAAGEHEIYRTLRRELRDLDAGGFVPPPPVPEEPAPPPEKAGGTAEPGSTSDAREESPAAASDEIRSEGNREQEPDAGVRDVPAPVERMEGLETGLSALMPNDWTEPDAADADAGDVGDGAPENDLDLETPGAAPAADPSDDFGFGIDLELVSGFGEDATPTLARDGSRVEEVEHVQDIEPAGEPSGDRSGAETGDTGRAPMTADPMEGLETGPPLSAEWGEDAEEDPETLEDEAAETPVAGVSPTENLGNLHPEFVPSDDASNTRPTGVDEEDGLELESTLPREYAAGAAEPEPPPGTNFETPPSAYDETRPPTWMTRESPGDWADTDELPEEDPADLPTAPMAAPRPRTAPPQRKLTRAGTPGAGRVAVLALAAVAVGVGGWFGWDRFVAGETGATTRVEILNLPQIPADLMPGMRQLSAAAVAQTVAELAGLPERSMLPPAPDGEWLAGRYLAGAGDYPAVPEYWRGVLSYVSVAEDAEDGIFMAAFDARLAEAGFQEEEAELIRGRALAGWEASAPERERVYGQMRAVATAALDLHQFLVGSEDQIDYEPATAGVSRDPVLEAVPASAELGTAMWERVDGITEALDDLGFLDTITTDGLVEIFLARLAATPVR